MGAEGEAHAAAGSQGGSGVGAVAAPAPAAATGLPKFGHRALKGTFDARLESNGRVVVPAAFRHAYAADGELLVRAHADQHLVLYSHRAFDVVVDELQARQAARGKLLDAGWRVDVYAAVTPLQIDRQHRIVIPPKLRDLVGFDEDVVFIGAVESVKIMKPPAADEVKERAGILDVLLDPTTWDGLSTDPA